MNSMEVGTHYLISFHEQNAPDSRDLEFLYQKGQTVNLGPVLETTGSDSSPKNLSLLHRH